MTMLAQRYTDIGSKCFLMQLRQYSAVFHALQANTRYSPNAFSILVHRLRRWPNIEKALGEYPVFAR